MWPEGATVARGSAPAPAKRDDSGRFIDDEDEDAVAILYPPLWTRTTDMVNRVDAAT